MVWIMGKFLARPDCAGQYCMRGRGYSLVYLDKLCRLRVVISNFLWTDQDVWGSFTPAAFHVSGKVVAGHCSSFECRHRQPAKLLPLNCLSQNKQTLVMPLMPVLDACRLWLLTRTL